MPGGVGPICSKLTSRRSSCSRRVNSYRLQVVRVHALGRQEPVRILCRRSDRRDDVDQKAVGIGNYEVSLPEILGPYGEYRTQPLGDDQPLPLGVHIGYCFPGP